MKKKKPLTRSQNMARIKSKNTKLEVYIRKLLFKMGYRYRINYPLLPGTPDIYILKYKTAIFVNGCFWHRHENCKIAHFLIHTQNSGGRSSGEMWKGIWKLRKSFLKWI